MDPWKYFSEGKSVLLSEELDFPVVDGLVRCKNKVMGCEIKPFLNSENYPLVSNTEALERLELMKLGLYNTVRKSCSSELNGEVFNDEIGSRISGDVREMNGLDYGLIDLKLGSQVHKEGEPVPSLSSSSPAKRPRTASLHSRITFCQVHGCNKDLSSSKDYHKRHKVCDAHTKTAKVIVNGVEQRFCQQCSRFHLLAEFDDGKRSCRRRLADHNKRRRKPQIAAQSGAKFMSSSLLKGSPFSPEVLPSVILTPTKHTKFEDSFTYSNPTLNMKTLGGRMNNISSGFCDNMVSYVNPRIQHLSSVLDPSCALSLLSAQSQNTSNSRTDKMGPTSIVLSPERDLTNTNYSLYHGHGTMVDLLQLSSNLQRIEQQRNNSPAQNDAR